MRKPQSLAAAIPPILGGLSLVWLWFSLANQLRIEWTVNPQYSYGWAVPFLGAYLRWQRLRAPSLGEPTSDFRPQTCDFGFRPSSAISYFLIALLALLYFPTRLAAIREGRRNLGQRSLEVAVWRLPDLPQAEAALQLELERLIHAPIASNP